MSDVPRWLGETVERRRFLAKVGKVAFACLLGGGWVGIQAQPAAACGHGYHKAGCCGLAYKKTCGSVANCTHVWFCCGSGVVCDCYDCWNKSPCCSKANCTPCPTCRSAETSIFSAPPSKIAC